MIKSLHLTASKPLLDKKSCTILANCAAFFLSMLFPALKKCHFLVYRSPSFSLD